MSSREIVVTDRDLWWLRALVRAHARTAARDQQHLEQLEAELERAHTIDPADLPDGVVTMHARMRVRDIGTGAAREYTLVFPHEADIVAGRLSVLAPLGTALLGYREGDEIVWEMPGGARRLRIEKVQSARRTMAGAADPGSGREGSRTHAPMGARVGRATAAHPAGWPQFDGAA